MGGREQDSGSHGMTLCSGTKLQSSQIHPNCLDCRRYLLHLEHTGIAWWVEPATDSAGICSNKR